MVQLYWDKILLVCYLYFIFYEAHRRSYNMENNIIIFENQDVKFDVNLKNDTVWLSLEQMSELFGRDKSVISRHIKNVFIEGELQKDSVVAKFTTTATHGKTYKIDYYNLDANIASAINKEKRMCMHIRSLYPPQMRE